MLLFSQYDAIFYSVGNFSAVQPANKLVDKWLDRSPDALMDPAGIWDDVITNR